MSSALQILSGGLCPWLEPSLARFESARALGQLGHAWLISGEEGIGKANLALVLAQRLFGAAASPTTLDADAALAAMAERHAPMDRHPDLHWLHPEEDKETISIDQIREVIETLTLTRTGTLPGGHRRARRGDDHARGQRAAQDPRGALGQ